MKTENVGLTKEEKVMFSLFGMILVIAIGILIINTLSEHERTLKVESPITEKEQEKIKEEESSSSNSDINLIEGNTDKANTPKIAYVTNLKTSKKSTKKMTNVVANVSNKAEINDTTIEEKPVFIEWDFPKDIVIEATEGTIIKIDRNVVLKDGSKAEAQVTIRKLIDDAYMIQDSSEGSLLLTAGTYKYYYTYADITKELVLTVKGNLNPTNASFPSIIDTEGLDSEYLNNYTETMKNSQISVTSNTLNLKLKNNKITEIPIYLTLSNDVKSASVSSKTFGVIVLKNAPDGYSTLTDNQIVMLINLEIISTTNLKEIEIIVNDVTYTLYVNITDSEDEKTETTEKPEEAEGTDKKDEDKKPSTETDEDITLLDKTNPNESVEEKDGTENTQNIDDGVISEITQAMKENILESLS